MKKTVLPIFLLIITLNGWATSRFSVYINGQKSGTITIDRKIEGNIVITTTKENLLLKRANTVIKTSDITIVKETKEGIPISIKYKNLEKNSSVFPEYFVKFTAKGAQITAGNEKKFIPVDIKKVKQDFGEELLIKKMIEKNIKKSEYISFSGSILNFEKNQIQYLGKTKKGYKFILKSSTLNILTNIITDKNGELIETSQEIAGIKIRQVRINGEKKGEKIKPAEILSPALIKLNYFFPRGYSVKSIKYVLKNSKPYDFTILEQPNQKVEITNDKSCILTVTKTKLPRKLTPDKDKKYLLSSKIINLNNPALEKIANKLKSKSKTPYEFVVNTVYFVFGYIRIKNFDNVIADTDTILKERKGDCTEHAFLATAILRKGGIPARCVIGLVMGQDNFAYHMWVEIKANGKWFPIDPTFMQVNPDPTHIKIDDFPITFSTMKNIYKYVLPLIRTLSIKPVSVTFNNGKTLNKPKEFFENLFKCNKWSYDKTLDCYILEGKQGIFKEKVLLSSIIRRNMASVGQKLYIYFGNTDGSMEEIKGEKIIVYQIKNKIAFVFIHNSVLIIFVAQTDRPVKMEKLKAFCLNKCLEVIEECKKRF